MEHKSSFASILKQLCKSLAIGVDRAADEMPPDNFSEGRCTEGNIRLEKGRKE